MHDTAWLASPVLSGGLQHLAGRDSWIVQLALLRLGWRTTCEPLQSLTAAG